MRLTALIAMVLALFLGSILGCGGPSVPSAEERPGVKARQEIQKEKKKQSYMKPEDD